MKTGSYMSGFHGNPTEMIDRPEATERLRRALRRVPVVALVGPRQCGKTTLARQLVPPGSAGYFDLEDPLSLARLTEPVTALSGLRGVVVIDEIQRRPDLFPVLRVLADRPGNRARFLVLGSASPTLLRQSSESLAGRLEVVGLTGFTASELGTRATARHWLRGGFPRSYLARSERDSAEWRRQFVQSFVERDIPQLVGALPAPALHRFSAMVAHYHGAVWHSADPARSLGVSEHTARRYLDVLTGLFMVRQLPPWHENLGKRQVKSPKVYLRDSGLLHSLLRINTLHDLLTHPKCGASWEGLVIETVLDLLRPDESYFWATHQGAELDLLAFKDGKRIGIEVKRQDAPGMSRSMHVALHDLKLERILVIYPGARRYELGDRATAVPFSDLVAQGPSAILKGVVRRRMQEPRRGKARR